MRRYLLRGTATLSLVVAAVTLTRPTESSAAPPLSGEDVAQVRKVVRPGENEDPFATIPWETDLWAARIKAAAAGKPLLLWEMDGHPLGCG
jgi:hypothetical protein